MEAITVEEVFEEVKQMWNLNENTKGRINSKFQIPNPK
jgi:hypothetical protein